MKRKFLALIVLCHCFLPVRHLQAVNLDSLQHLISTTDSDTHRVSLLNKLGYELRRTAPKEALDHLAEAEILARKVGFPAGVAKGQLYRGMIYTATGAFAEAEKSLQEARAGYGKLRDANGTGKAWNKLGILYFYQNDPEKAIAHYERALEHFTDLRAVAMCHNNMALAYKTQGEMDAYLASMLRSRTAFEDLGDLKSVAMVYGNLGTFYRNLEDNEQAIAFYEKSAAVLPEGGDLELQASNAMNLGLAYESAGQNEAALEKYRAAVALAHEGGLVLEEGMALNNLANFYEEKGEYAKAGTRYEAALAMFEQAGNVKFQAAVVNNLSEMLHSQGEGEAAVRMLHRSLGLAVESGDLVRIEQVYQNLAGLYEELGQAESALLYQKKAMQIGDSLLDEAKLKEIVAMEIEYEAGRREQQLEAEILGKNRVVRMNFWLWLGMGLLVLCLLGVGGLVLMQRRSIRRLRQEHFDLGMAYGEVTGRLEQMAAVASKEQRGAGQGPGLPAEFETLSKREIEVFLCLANGMTNKEVGEELHISVDTVRSHVKNIYGKLGVNNRAMVVKMAHEYGLR